jgi:F-type H+-transporting ATPase subunit epsilon
MRTFQVVLRSPWGSETIEDAVGFVGRDASGSFGVLADAERRVTVLDFGLAQVQHADGTTEYLALPGGVFYFLDNHLTVATSNFVRSRSYQEVLEALDHRLLKQEERVHDIKESVKDLEEALLRRLSEVQEGA